MPNERITEAIIRKHFEKFDADIVIEEQQSENPRITKLLKNASKKGAQHGRPEFIISYKSNPDFLIAVECKGSPNKHQSATLNKYGGYAVDDALLYASYLSKEYDVLAIAASGQNKSELKVSHYLHLKNESQAVPIFNSKLLDVSSYLYGYLKSPEKFRQDYHSLLEFTNKLNIQLHGHKILESQRSLLISCILIALENNGFKAAYPLLGVTDISDSKQKSNRAINAPKELANYLVDTVSNELLNAGIDGEKLENLKIQFGFIRTDTSLSTKKDVLKNLIDDIDKNINSFIKTHEYFDVLGQLYIEFLRYANSDKGLGIVLTPPHITELFADLAQVNKNSIVFDNCTGTGGFLISAMQKMIKSAKGDEVKIKQIKQSSLIGVEYQAHIFALAVTNMYIHQDGKTNIIKGSCFDNDIIEFVRSKKPTIGFLNPPYKADKKKDDEELKFVLNNLDCLEVGGTCVTILPMASALAQTGKIHEYKRRILEGHTLEAVLSMPDELFFNSNVGVVSCIMIFTAHKPHSTKKETYFGYYKNDGFEKRKNKGRIDLHGKWPEIKQKWVDSFLNRKEEPGFSVKQIVTCDDEWCAEAYMETDYTKLSKDHFIKTLKSFVLINELYFKNETGSIK